MLLPLAGIAVGGFTHGVWLVFRRGLAAMSGARKVAGNDLDVQVPTWAANQAHLREWNGYRRFEGEAKNARWNDCSMD